MTAKEYLSQARKLDQRIGALLDRQKKYHDLGAWRPICFDGAKGPRAMVALERELDARIAEYAEKVRAIERVIDAVEDAQYRDVLRYRYLNGWGWQKVADRMHFSQDWVCRLHARALAAVRVPEQNSTGKAGFGDL